ncbi:MAG: hypothetical protein AAGH46_00095 [Bacteroidota bacterium]
MVFYRYSNQDGLYNLALILEYPSINDAYFVGHQIGTILGTELIKNLALELETNLIFPGAFLIESDLNNTLFHAVLTMEYRF